MKPMFSLFDLLPQLTEAELSAARAWDQIERDSADYIDAIEADMFDRSERAWPTRTGVKLTVVQGGVL